MNGVTRSCPPTSPSHHVNHTPEKLAGSAKPESTKLPTPTLALIIVPGQSARQAKTTTWLGVSKGLADRAHRFNSKAVIKASIVLPPAIKQDVNSEPKVVALARNAPVAIAGHRPFPHNSKLASASPLGGHTGLALGWSEANVSAPLATRK
jgi:hypothetical protein